MKRFTLGVTTHNEEETISGLLDAMACLDPRKVDLIVYDDCSTDRTKEVIIAHPVARQENFIAEFSETNGGTPSIGRTFIGRTSKTEYTSLVDGDDTIDPQEYSRLMEIAPSGYDFILTKRSLRGRKIGIGEAGEVSLNMDTVTRIFSGVAGKLYKTSLLAKYGPDEVKGRSDDVRLNLRIIESGYTRFFSIPDICYYITDSSRKSMRASTLNFDEMKIRVDRHKKLSAIYPIGDRYIKSTEEQVRQVVAKDPSLSPEDRARMRQRLDQIFAPSRVSNISIPKPASSPPRAAIGSRRAEAEALPHIVKLRSQIEELERRRDARISARRGRQ